jgi:DNA-binding MarR family transcriptional regulator
MGKTLGRLERDGLIRIEPSPVDGRSRVIKLTSNGNRVFQDAVPLWRQAQQQLAELNGARWIGALRSSLSEIKVERTTHCALIEARLTHPSTGMHLQRFPAGQPR